MTWVNWPREFKYYNTKEDSYKDFKRIWTSYYGWLPNLEKAKRYSWNDRAEAWLNNVLAYYNKN
jgi:fatty-acid desaturase